METYQSWDLASFKSIPKYLRKMRVKNSGLRSDVFDLRKADVKRSKAEKKMPLAPLLFVESLYGYGWPAEIDLMLASHRSKGLRDVNA